MSVKRYHIIYADAAWRFRDKLPGNRGVDKKYKSTMTVRDIMALNIPPTFEDALLFFWRVGAMVPEAYDVIKAWGFEGKSEIVWNKTQSYVGTEPPEVPDPPRRFGTGHYVRNEHEVCIIAGKGHASSLIQNHSVRSTIFAPRPLKHSEKPAIIFEVINALVGDLGPRAELFARQHRDGWDCFGDEIGTIIPFGLLGRTS